MYQLRIHFKEVGILPTKFTCAFRMFMTANSDHSPAHASTGSLEQRRQFSRFADLASQYIYLSN